MRIRKLVAAGLLAILPFGLVACTDEDGDGAGADEEIEQVDEFVEDVVEDLEQEIEEGAKEIED
ncbi:MAG: hypothetical protein OEY55_12925 [Acidimicrobiia bacterium]|nr:hypothetical protein [Acidimicrobiia bacterium]MDH5505298.1 hypothetical protein [Acidimicrobiia bacterium]